MIALHVLMPLPLSQHLQTDVMPRHDGNGFLLLEWQDAAICLSGIVAFYGVDERCTQLP